MFIHTIEGHHPNSRRRQMRRILVKLGEALLCLHHVRLIGVPLLRTLLRRRPRRKHRLIRLRGHEMRPQEALPLLGFIGGTVHGLLHHVHGRDGATLQKRFEETHGDLLVLVLHHPQPAVPQGRLVHLVGQCGGTRGCGLEIQCHCCHDVLPSL